MEVETQTKKCTHCYGSGKCQCINCFRGYFDELEVTDHEFASSTVKPAVPCESCGGKGTIGQAPIMKGPERKKMTPENDVERRIEEIKALFSEGKVPEGIELLGDSLMETKDWRLKVFLYELLKGVLEHQEKKEGEPKC